MYRYFTQYRTYKFTDVLQDIVRNYNGRPHRSLDGLSPRDINKSNEAVTWKKLYIYVLKPSVLKKKVDISHKRFKFKVGGYVRLTGIKHTFSATLRTKMDGGTFIVSRRFLRQRYRCTKLRIMIGTPSRVIL